MPANTVHEHITAIAASTAPAAERYAVGNWEGAPRTFTNTHVKGAGDKALLPYWRKNEVKVDGKAFECTCTTLFTRATDVVRHIANQHFGGQWYKCNHCDTTSKNKSWLGGDHQRAAGHDGAPSKYKCSACGVEKGDRSEFYRHCKDQHGEEFEASTREILTGKVPTTRASRDSKGTKSAGLKRGREDGTLQGEAGSEEELAAAGSSRRKRVQVSTNSTAGSLRAPAGALQGVAGLKEMAGMPSSSGLGMQWGGFEYERARSPVYRYGVPQGVYQVAEGSGVQVNPALLAMAGSEAMRPRMMTPVPQGTGQEARQELPSAACFREAEPQLFDGMVSNMNLGGGMMAEGNGALQEQSSSRRNQLGSSYDLGEVNGSGGGAENVALAQNHGGTGFDMDGDFDEAFFTL